MTEGDVTLLFPSNPLRNGNSQTSSYRDSEIIFKIFSYILHCSEICTQSCININSVVSHLSTFFSFSFFWRYEFA
jgi:hypothetical protein